MLKIKDLDVYYGVIHALKKVSLDVQEGEIISLIGANGAGKSTTLRAISGIIPSSGGSMSFKNKEITKFTTGAIVKQGIVHVPEGRKIFTDMSVYENLQIGAYQRKDKVQIKKDIDEMCERFPILGKRRNQLAGTLSGGEQQMLAISRALMAKPTLLLLDEPSMGLSPVLVREIFNLIKEINTTGTTVLLVEQNANMALSIASRAYIMETGVIVKSGEAKALAASDDVKKAYLGA